MVKIDTHSLKPTPRISKRIRLGPDFSNPNSRQCGYELILHLLCMKIISAQNRHAQPEIKPENFREVTFRPGILEGQN